MFTLLILTAIVAILLISLFQKIKSVPPGPIPFPLIGNLPQLALMMRKHGGIVDVMKELQKKYGNVFTLWLGPDPTVHICDLELAQETMVKRGHEFVDRWATTLLYEINAGIGIINSNGPFWNEHRRFMLHTFRNFGLGRGIMEERIMMEYNLRMKDLDRKLAYGENVVETNPFIELLVGSIINRILFNERLEEEDEKEFFQLKKEADQVNDFSVIDFYAGNKWLWKIPYLRKRWIWISNSLSSVKIFLQKQVATRLKAIETGDHVIEETPEDYVDYFIVKMKEEEKDSDSIYTEETLIANLWDLWQAGQDTITATIISGFVHMLNNPKIQEEARKELVSVTENKRQLSLTDKKSTPYLNALIMEIQRHASIVLVNLFRQTSSDLTVGGHFVAKGTPITAEISVLMENDKLFKNSADFDPTRFLKNPDLDKHVLPFSLGKRSCPGESLARAELYLIIGNLLLDYKFERIGDKPLSDMVCKEAFFKLPEKYSMRVAKAN